MGKSLRHIIPDFTEAIYETHSGEESLNKYVKPLLENANLFYRVSSFFTPSAIKKIFSQLTVCLQKGGDIKFVIGLHDSEKLLPILDNIYNRDSESRFIEAVEELISGQLDDLLDIIETHDEFLIVFSELIHQNHIKIKISTVRKDYESFQENNAWPKRPSIFHAKSSILKDTDDTVIIGGTINFSNQGYGDNVEDVVILGSWFSPKACHNAENEFIQIWENAHKDVYTLDFSESIRNIITLMISKSEKIKLKLNSMMKNSLNSDHLLWLIQNSPLFYHNSFQNVKLLPHQKEVYRSLLSRWPIQAILADEVGLGKTVEAGATIKYLKKFCAVNRSAILVPSSLRYQWQREMYNLFGMKYYVYEPGSKSLVFSPNNDQLDQLNYVGQGNYYDHGVNNIIFSWHYLRLRGANGEYRLSNTDQIDLIVVDEAHAARVTESLAFGQDATQLHQFLSELLPQIKHKLLLTATPYQTSLLDYQSLLELLMPYDILEESSFKRISRINAGGDLSSQQKVSGMLEIIERKAYKSIEIGDELDPNNLPSLVNSYEDILYTLNHPSTVFTIRNTRDNLKQIGYHFPEAEIASSPIALNKKQNKLFTRVNEYIENHLFDFETAVKGKSAGLGFVRTIYQQRIVSSFKACLDTLTSRLNRLQLNIDNGYVEGELIELDVDEMEDLARTSVYERIELNDVHIDAAQIEINFIKEILAAIQNILYADSELQDPKMEKAIAIVTKHLIQGDTIILFSKFTSTTNFLVESMKKINKFSFGRYQGDKKEIIIDQVEYSYDRQTLSDKFSKGEFPVIICSDAASEGLNLQKANVLINVDVPWNPARLLQRFGRIDRFGQNKDHLFFYNLYYPYTVEDRIYTRLIDRNSGFRQILGTTPQITSPDHIKDLTNRELRDSVEQTDYLYKNSLLKLVLEDNIRIHDHLLDCIERSDNIILSSLSRNNSGIIQDGIIEISNLQYRFSTNEMNKDYLNLNHSFLKDLRIHEISNGTKLYELMNKQNQLLTYCIKQNNNYIPLLSIEELLDYLIIHTPISIDDASPKLDQNNLDRDFVNLISTDAHKFIYHNFINFNDQYSSMYNGLFIKETEFLVELK